MVPCHRVVSSDLSIGGFSGATSIASPEICNKVELLKEEGVLTATRNGRIKVRAVVGKGAAHGRK
jgi:alkylated DNA nucleotide flippase Atl1